MVLYRTTPFTLAVFLKSVQQKQLRTLTLSGVFCCWLVSCSLRLSVSRSAASALCATHTFTFYTPDIQSDNEMIIRALLLETAGTEALRS